MIYRVKIMPMAEAAIDCYIDYITKELGSPFTAERVLRRIHTTISKLETFPHAGGRAPEDTFREYLIRFRMVGQCLLLYNVNDRKQEVRIIGFRHGSQLPQPEELPEV